MLKNKEIQNESFFWVAQVREIKKNNRKSIWIEEFSIHAPNPKIAPEKSIYAKQILNNLKARIKDYYPPGEYQCRIVLQREATEIYPNEKINYITKEKDY